MEDQAALELSSTNSKSRLGRGGLSQLCSVGRSVKTVLLPVDLYSGLLDTAYKYPPASGGFYQAGGLWPKSLLINCKDMCTVLKFIFQRGKPLSSFQVILGNIFFTL